MKKNIALVSGGNSGEYEISIKSGKVIQKNMDTDRYNVFPIVIRGKDWLYHSNDGSSIAVDKNDFSVRVNGEKITFDCVFIAIHGTPGEDGMLQGYLEMIGLPYTSCNMFTSAVTFKKSFASRMAGALGVNIARSVAFHRSNPMPVEKILNEISLPCFVKPEKAGSSVGITKVKKAEDLEAALQIAFKEDDELVVEEMITGSEITCGVIRSQGRMIVLPLTQIVSKKDFFDYEAKYTEGLSEEIVPAPISLEDEKQCKSISAYLYEKLNCEGVVRFDYFLTEKGFYFLEVNTIPGLTEESIVPKMVREMGLTVSDLYTMLIEDALYRKAQKEANR